MTVRDQLTYDLATEIVALFKEVDEDLTTTERMQHIGVTPGAGGQYVVALSPQQDRVWVEFFFDRESDPVRVKRYIQATIRAAAAVGVAGLEARKRGQHPRPGQDAPVKIQVTRAAFYNPAVRSFLLGLAAAHF